MTPERWLPGWSITRGNQATPHLWRITTAPINARSCKTSLDCTTTIRSGRRMGAGSTLCAVGQPRVRWTCGAFRRTAGNRNNSHISTPMSRSRLQSTSAQLQQTSRVRNDHATLRHHCQEQERRKNHQMHNALQNRRPSRAQCRLTQNERHKQQHNLFRL
jgi:hypothetical protein